MRADLLQGFYLGDLLVEPLKGRVTGRDGPAHLPSKAMEVLVCLAGSPGEVLARDDLIGRVWGEGHGSAEALSHAVSDIRHALGDRAASPTFIQTLPRRGYRLIVDPELVTDNTSSIVIGVTDGARIGDIGLVENLKRRGVLETGLAYLVVGWLVIQATDIVFEQLHLPEWLGTFVTVLVIAGFPIALVLSWFLDIRDGRTRGRETYANLRRRRFSRTYLSVVGALAIASVAVWVYDRNIGLPTSIDGVPEPDDLEGPPVTDNSIAVLPFFNIDGSNETQVFANGLAEDVITRLSRIPELRVSSRGDSFTLAPNSASSQVRDRLRVAMYLEGSVELAADRIRVAVQLINSATGFHMLSRRFDRPREDFFDLRDEITQLAVANLRVALPPQTRLVPEGDYDPPSLDAYVLYRRGMDISRQPLSPESIATAVRWFDEALAVDPDYAAAHAGKCAIYAAGYPHSDDPAFIDLAEASCSVALTLNPNLDIVHTALGDLYRTTGRYRDAETAYQRALTIDPNSVESLLGLGNTYRQQNRPEEAEAALRKAVGLHPGDWSAYNALGFLLFSSGRYAEAAEQYENVVAVDGGNITGYTNLGTAWMLAGNFAKAAPAFAHAIDLEPRSFTYSNLGLMYYYLGRFDEAIDAHRKAVELAPKDYLTWSNLGDTLWIAGEHDESREAFRTAERLVLAALEINPVDAGFLMDLAWISTMLGKSGEARRLIDDAADKAPADPYVHYIDGLIHFRPGETDDAMAAFETAAAQGYPLVLLSAEPYLEELREHPRFKAILSERSAPVAQSRAAARSYGQFGHSLIRAPGRARTADCMHLA